MKILKLLLCLLFISSVAHAGIGVEDVAKNGDWPNGSTDAAPVSLYGHTAPNVIAPLQLAANGTIGTTTAAQALVVVATDTNNTYVCSAAVGSARASAVWQCYYVFISGTTTTITWADGNTNFDNIATSPQSLSYS